MVASKAYTKLFRAVERSERKRGLSLARARYIAGSVAGQMALRKRRAAASAATKRKRTQSTGKRSGSRRNPGRKAPPSHDLFGERAHKTSLFDEVKYAAVPKPARKPPKRKGKAAIRSQGRLSFGLGLFD